MSFDFSEIQLALDKDTNLRELIKEESKTLEALTRSATFAISRIHNPKHDTKKIIEDLEQIHIPEIKSSLERLEKCIPGHLFYKYSEILVRALQQVVFIVAFIVFVKEDRLVKIGEVSELVGIRVSADSDGFHLPVEDFLHGLVSLCSELSRLAMTSVIACNYDFPLKIAGFLGELYAGFQLLNLKNDSLRRRFDSMKYDIKKVEEVVFNVKLRGLASDNSLNLSDA